MVFSRLLGFSFVFLGLFVVTTALAEPDVKVSDAAKEHFRAGIAHVDDPAGAKYEEAYREFKVAFADSPSYQIAVNIGYCAFFLERDAEALEMYELFLSKAKEKDISKKKRAQMEKDIQSLRAGLVKVSLKVSPANATLTDERFSSKGNSVVNRYPIEAGAAQLGIHPGSHKFTVSADGFAPQSWEFEAGPGTAHSHDFTLEAVGAVKAAEGAVESAPAAPPPTKDVAASTQTKQKTSPMVYVGLVATGALAAGAIGLGLTTNSKKNDFEAANDGTQRAKAESLRSDVKTFALVTDVCIGAAILSAGATAYFYFAGGSRAPAPQRSGWQLTPTVGASQAGIELVSRF